MRGNMPWNGFRTIPKEIPPWYPEWTANAACAHTELSFIELDDIFFDYGRNKVKIRKAKKICAMCPVIKKCYRTNREVPIGIYYGMTAIERWRERGLKGYPNIKDASSYFGQFFGKRYNGIGMRGRKKNGKD